MNNKIKIIKNIMNTTIITKELIDPTIKINKKKLLKDSFSRSKNNKE